MTPTVSFAVVRLSVDIAEIQIRAVFAVDPGPAAQLRGRLMGPRCPGVSTIEVAYPIQPLSSNDPMLLLGRVLIPEPNLWTPNRPMIYWGPVEVWLGGQMASSQGIEVGLKKAQS